MKNLLSNTTYDILKYVIVIVLPAITVAISALQQIYGWGEIATDIVLTIPIVQSFLGTIFCISSATYKTEDYIQ